MEKVKIQEVAFDSALYHQVYRLRDEILRKPINLSLDDEDLSDEINDYILAALIDDDVIGCLILTLKENKLQLRQMAIAESHQKKGLGSILVKAAEKLTIEKGYSAIVLHARMVAKDFYLKLGYQQISDIFTEVGIDHVIMEKKLIETL